MTHTSASVWTIALISFQIAARQRGAGFELVGCPAILRAAGASGAGRLGTRVIGVRGLSRSARHLAKARQRCNPNKISHWFALFVSLVACKRSRVAGVA